jgi:hypothetical protein
MVVIHGNIGVEPFSATATVAARRNHARKYVGAIVEERRCKSTENLKLKFQHNGQPHAGSPYLAKTWWRLPMSGGTSVSFTPNSSEYSAR